MPRAKPHRIAPSLLVNLLDVNGLTVKFLSARKYDSTWAFGRLYL